MPLISAHRGECGVAGLPAAERFRRAIALGVDYIEFDVRRTADGVNVISHDDRTASGRAVHDLAYAEFAEELGPESLTLDELFDLAAGRVGIHIDLKEVGYEADIVRVALARCPPDRLVFTSADDVIRSVKEQFPNVRAGLTLGEDVTGLVPWLKADKRLSELFPRRRLQRCHADFASVHHQLARARVLAYCARARLPAWVWTVDDEAEIARFIKDPRVAVLITNRPDIALRLRRA